MPYTVQITRKAFWEIDQSLEWLMDRSTSAAVKWHEGLMQAVRSLADNPERCGIAPESEWYPGEIRQLLYGKRRGVFRVIFEVKDDTVTILRVRHGAQALLEPGEL
jgi:plasmid stabilization system protein ParE